MIIEWIGNNDHIETLYIMGSGFEGSARDKLESGWKKHLISHRTDNLGMTFIRVVFNPNPQDPEE